MAPKQIKSIRGDTSCVICGKISAFSEKTAKNSGKLYYKFILTDPTGEVDCLYFPRGKNPQLIKTLVQNDDEIAVFGDILTLPQPNSCGNIHKYYALLSAVLCYYIDTE